MNDSQAPTRAPFEVPPDRVPAGKYLVTGGAGFIGSSLCHALVERGAQVRVLDDLSSGKMKNLAGLEDRIEFIEGSLLDLSVLKQAVADIDTIFHQAAIPSVPRSIAEPIANHHANATGTLNLLEAARAARVRRVVYAGSSSAYGETPTLPKVESMPPAPCSPYAASKLAGEHYLMVYNRIHGLQTVVLRYFNVFGPRQDPTSQYAAVIPRFITAALRGEAPVIYGDGTQSRDFCYIDNVIEANLAAAWARDAPGGIFNIACGQAIELNAVVALIGKLLGRTVRARHEPARPGDIKHSLADITAARQHLGYRGAIGFEEGLRRTIAWFAAQGQGT